MTTSERNSILLAAAKKAEKDYRRNRSLTAFDAFGKEDLYGESSIAASR